MSCGQSRLPGCRAVAQRPIAGVVPVRVVEYLEVVEVQRGQAECALPPVSELAFEPLVPSAPVREARQRVGRRQSGHVREQHGALLVSLFEPCGVLADLGNEPLHCRAEQSRHRDEQNAPTPSAGP